MIENASKEEIAWQDVVVNSGLGWNVQEIIVILCAGFNVNLILNDPND